MEEIKFKVWDSWHECMFDVEWVGFNPLWVGIIDVDVDSNGDPIQVQRKLESHFELRRFTGKLDKNGKEIYEGDIVKNIFQGKVQILVCEWKEHGFHFRDCKDQIDKYITNGEIIGNIYQNGDLIK